MHAWKVSIEQQDLSLVLLRDRLTGRDRSLYEKKQDGGMCGLESLVGKQGCIGEPLSCKSSTLVAHTHARARVAAQK